ncbi:MAG: MlaC/ttg2D family ABC transporter substrate-binding protein [Bdellovibrionota bacterium]|jgi:phospholipid transport system substrate-binding protein
MKKGFLVFSLIGALFFSGSTVLAETPKAIIQSTIDKLVQVVETLPGQANAAKRREEMRTVITARFNFAEMSKSSLSRYWKDLTEAERQEFIEVFSELLAKTYLDRIDSIERDVVAVNSERISKARAIVKTTVTYKGDVFPIDYRMVQKDGEWKVYDVVIENIGLVNNYRNEFAGIIRKEKFSGLLLKLKEKLAKPDPAK